MNDIGLMTIVDTRENLFHEHCTIAFREFTALKDFVEELASLANSRNIAKKLYTNMSKLHQIKLKEG